MSNISHQENANKNHREMPLHILWDGITKMTDDKQGCGEIGTPYLASGNVITRSDGFEKSGHFFQMLNTELACNLAIAFLLIPEELKRRSHKNSHTHECSQQHYSSWLKRGNSSVRPRTEKQNLS